MQNTNGHGSRRAILYARIPTDERARSGYNLAQQLEELREHTARGGYEVLEEVVDPGQSGASLERPSMDRVRDLGAAGGVSAPLATGPGLLHTRTGLPLPAQAGVRGARLQDEGPSTTRETAARKANSPTESSPSWPSMNEHSAAPHQPLVCGAWKEERIRAEGTLTRTVRGCATPPLAPTLDAPPDATRLLRSKPLTRWVSTRSWWR
jgi:hypothetical protein